MLTAKASSSTGQVIPTAPSWFELMAGQNNRALSNVSDMDTYVHMGQMNGSPVAIKVLVDNPPTADDNKDINKKNFDREEAMLARLSHGNVLSLLARTNIMPSGNAYFVMEYAPDGDLHDYVSNAQPKGLDWAVILPFAHHIISGLAYLHKEGVAHRDLKPENIMVMTSDGECKIGDLGLSADDYPSDYSERTAKDGDFCGSPGFAPPEVYNKDNNAVSLKQDIFSLAMVLWFMAEGKTVASGYGINPLDEEAAVKLAVKTCSTDRPHIVRANEHRGYANQIRKAWSADPKERQTAKALEPVFGMFVETVKSKKGLG